MTCTICCGRARRCKTSILTTYTYIYSHADDVLRELYTGKILKTRTWFDIDVGVGSGQPPVLLRLDDLQEFYAEA